MLVRILDLDGGVAAQRDLVARATDVVPMRDWGPRVRIACSFASFGRFEQECIEDRVAGASGPAITFLGSGDFHHVTLALLRRLREPFNLLIVDKHPDWVRGAPLVHCGTWVSHAVRVPGLERLFHVGADLDLDNWLQRFAPWPELMSGKITVVPARRRLTRGRWKSVACEPLRTEPETPLAPDRLEHLCGRFLGDLRALPLYISIDKDVMRAADAVVNWDSGALELDEIRAILDWFIGAAGGRVLGADVTGDWSRHQARGLLRNALHLGEHPPLRIDPREAALVNGCTNLALIDTIAHAAARSNA